MKVPTLNPIRRTDLLLMLVIILIGAAARLYLIDLADFGYDQAINVTIAQTVLATGQPAPFSSASAFEGGAPPHPPLLIYLLALPLALGSDVLGSTIVITLLNILAIGLLWYLGHRYFSPLIGLIAALLLAVNPWAVYYSRFIWQPNITIPFILLALVISGLAFLEGKRWAQIAFLPALSLVAQTHYAALLTFPAFLWLLWIGRKSIDWRRMTLGLVIAVILALPYGLGVLNWFQNRTRGTGGGLISQFLFTEFNPAPLNYALWFTTGLDLEDVVNTIRGVPILQIWLAALIPLAIGLVRLPLRYLRVGMSILLIVIVPIAATITTDYRLFPHYFSLMQPPLLLLVAIGAAWVVERLASRPALRWLALSVIIVFCGSQFVWNLGLLNAIEQKLVIYPRQPMRYLFEVRDAALVNRDVVIFYPHPEQSGYANLRPILKTGADCIREFAIAEGGLILRPRGAFSAVFSPIGYLYDFMTDIKTIPYESIYRVGGATTVTLPENSYTYTIYNVPPLPQFDPVPITALGPYTFANGVQLIGYALDSGQVYLRWLLPKSTPTDYQVSIHFLDASGQTIGQRDTSFYPGKYWCDGDELTTWIDAPQPPDSLTLRISMYRLTENNYPAGSDVFDLNGSQMPWIDIPLPTNQTVNSGD